MAGSYRHLLDENGRYQGFRLIERLNEAEEAVEELFAMVQWLSEGNRMLIFDSWREGYLRPHNPQAADAATAEDFWRDHGGSCGHVRPDAEKQRQPKAKAGSLKMLIYMAAYPKIQEVARDLGYAVAIHGSVVNDLDVVAVPWVENAADPERLVNEIASAYRHLTEPYGSEIVLYGPEQKPNGRLAWNMSFGSGLVLDISVTPRTP